MCRAIPWRGYSELVDLLDLGHAVVGLWLLSA